MTANHPKKCYNRLKSKNTSTTTFTNPRVFLKKVYIIHSDAEEKAGKYGMLELAKVLKDELEKN
ncbi:hypothetical protein E2R56_00635 [Rhodococcus qingshengii]|nr:hypothetical protein E2R56_00635 [Rhodococcus qingshengii]